MKDLINDGQRLTSAKTQWGSEVPVYDDGFGPLWIARSSIHTYGIVRAQTWEDAWEICEDELFDEASETIDELKAEYGFRRKEEKLIRLPDGTERYAQLSDYTGEHGTLPDEITFVKWVTVETPDPGAWTENELFQEAYGFRPNGPNDRDKLKHGIYSKDLNGDYLDALTPELLAELEITLEIEDED